MRFPLNQILSGWPPCFTNQLHDDGNGHLVSLQDCAGACVHDLEALERVLAPDPVPRMVRDKCGRSPATGSGPTATCSLHRPEPRSVIVPMGGLPIVNAHRLDVLTRPQDGAAGISQAKEGSARRSSANAGHNGATFRGYNGTILGILGAAAPIGRANARR